MVLHLVTTPGDDNESGAKNDLVSSEEEFIESKDLFEEIMGMIRKFCEEMNYLGTAEEMTTYLTHDDEVAKEVFHMLEQRSSPKGEIIILLVPEKDEDVFEGAEGGNHWTLCITTGDNLSDLPLGTRMLRLSKLDFVSDYDGRNLDDISDMLVREFGEKDERGKLFSEYVRLVEDWIQNKGPITDITRTSIEIKRLELQLGEPARAARRYLEYIYNYGN